MVSKIWIIFHFIYGMSSFPLTFIFFKVKTTSQEKITDTSRINESIFFGSSQNSVDFHEEMDHERSDLCNKWGLKHEIFMTAA